MSGLSSEPRFKAVGSSSGMTQALLRVSGEQTRLASRPSQGCLGKVFLVDLLDFQSDLNERIELPI